ncbi:MAG: hypothetical protein VYD70_02240 [Planctomycetota bacterium]|nr:hypothetical protein [Planctomycetota bacterium]
MTRYGLLLILMFFPLIVLGQDAEAEVTADKKPYFWIRMWPDFLIKYDIEKDEEVARIQAKNGVCHGTTYSHDKTQAFLITGKQSKVEVLDLINNEVVEVHDFTETGWLIRIEDVNEIPGGKKWYVNIDRVKLEPDHYKIEKSQWLLYDVTEKKILKRMDELPSAIRRGSQISPDGKYWHVFGRDFQVIDPDTLKEVSKIDLSTPVYTGMGRFQVSGRTDLLHGQDKGRYRLFYSMADPVHDHRRIGGVLELDLDQMEVANRQEWGPPLNTSYVTWDGKKSIGTGGRGWRGGGGGQENGVDPILTFVNYSLEDGSKLLETRVPSRNGLRLSGISPDGGKLYLAGRGHELVIYDGDHQYLKTVELDGEIESWLHLAWQ